LAIVYSLFFTLKENAITVISRMDECWVAIRLKDTNCCGKAKKKTYVQQEIGILVFGRAFQLPAGGREL